MCSGVSTFFPMCSGFYFQIRRHICAEFFVGSRPCWFFPGTAVFLPPQKPPFPNPSSTWNARSPLSELLEVLWSLVGKQITLTRCVCV